MQQPHSQQQLHVTPFPFSGILELDPRGGGFVRTGVDLQQCNANCRHVLTLLKVA